MPNESWPVQLPEGMRAIELKVKLITSANNNELKELFDSISIPGKKFLVTEFKEIPPISA